MIHVAITRRVRPGSEPEFERRVAELFEHAQQDPGVLGAYLLRPVDESTREYGVLRTFVDPAARERFYASALYREWDASVASLVEGSSRKRDIHGLEGFFVSPSEGAPPAWKMAIVTWLAVSLSVFVFAHLVPALVGPLPPLVELMVVNALVVVSLTWVLMPLLTRSLHRWLRPPTPKGS